jgi:ABC-type glutathione transport system ATPase component
VCISAIASLSTENCNTMLEAAGESGKPLGIQLVLKVLPDKIRNKGESYFVEKFKKLKSQRDESSQLRASETTTVNQEQFTTHLQIKIFW